MNTKDDGEWMSLGFTIYKVMNQNRNAYGASPPLTCCIQYNDQIARWPVNQQSRPAKLLCQRLIASTDRSLGPMMKRTEIISGHPDLTLLGAQLFHLSIVRLALGNLYFPIISHILCTTSTSSPLPVMFPT